MKEFKLAEHEAWYIENIGLYRGHLYVVTFSVQMGIRCGYVLLNDDDNYNLDEYETIVNAHGGVTLAENDASHLFQESDLQHHRIIGWDYNHVFDGGDFATSKEYAEQHPELKLSGLLSIMENAYSIDTEFHIATCEEVSEDAMNVIDDIVYHRDTGKYRWDADKDDDNE